MKLKSFVNILIVFIVVGLWCLLKITIYHKRAAEGASRKVRTLYLYSLNNYFPDEIVKAFEKENNCHVQYDTFSSNEELLAKMQGGASGYDVLIPSDFIVKALIASDLISPLDKSLLPNAKNIAPEFLNVPYDPESKFTVPYKWGTTGFIYNTQRISENLESWNDVFKPKFAGKISIFDDEREALGLHLQNLGYSANSTDMRELRQAQKLMMERKPMIRVFSTDPRQLLLTNDVWISQLFSGDAMQINRENKNFKYVIPKEGGIFWIDAMAIPKDAKNKDLSYAFINFILRPEIELINVRTLFYSSPNKGLESSDLNPFLKASFIKKLDFKHLEFIKDIGIDGQKWDLIWTEIKSQ